MYSECLSVSELICLRWRRGSDLYCVSFLSCVVLGVFVPFVAFGLRRVFR